MVAMVVGATGRNASRRGEARHGGGMEIKVMGEARHRVGGRKSATQDASETKATWRRSWVRTTGVE